MDKALHTTHGRTTSHGLPHVKQNLHATAGQSHSGTTGRTVGRGKREEQPLPQPLPKREGSNYHQPSCIAFPRFPHLHLLSLSSPRSSLRFFTLHLLMKLKKKRRNQELTSLIVRVTMRDCITLQKKSSEPQAIVNPHGG